MKKETMISSARKSATANPFVLYDFYEQLEKVVKLEKLSASQIRSCDESGDPSNCKVISTKGQVCYRVTCGAGRENITILAGSCASGECLDPLIIFQGKNLQSTGRRERALPSIWYRVSSNGWMTTDILMLGLKSFLSKLTFSRFYCCLMII